MGLRNPTKILLWFGSSMTLNVRKAWPPMWHYWEVGTSGRMSGHWGSFFDRNNGTSALYSLSLSLAHDVSLCFSTTRSHRVLLDHSRPKQWGHLIRDWNFQNREPKSLFLLLCWLSHIFVIVTEAWITDTILGLHICIFLQLQVIFNSSLWAGKNHT
jgi:hypothetical protein